MSGNGIRSEYRGWTVTFGLRKGTKRRKQNHFHTAKEAEDDRKIRTGIPVKRPKYKWWNNDEEDTDT